MMIAKEIVGILCDDVREEVGNKFSIMGIYDDDVVFSSLPSMLPKLCLVVQIKEMKINITTYKIKVFSPENDSPKEFNIPAPPIDDDHKNTRLIIALSPFRASKCGDARIEVFNDDEKKPFYIHKFGLKTSVPLDRNSGSDKA